MEVFLLYRRNYDLVFEQRRLKSYIFMNNFDLTEAVTLLKCNRQVRGSNPDRYTHYP